MTDAADLRHRLEVVLDEGDLMPATRATIADFLRVVPPSDRRLHELAQLVASCPVGGVVCARAPSSRSRGSSSPPAARLKGL